jgi:hypothetical protein
VPQELLTVHDLNLTQSITLSLIHGGNKGFRYAAEVWLRQGATANFTVTLPAGVKWAGGVAPTIDKSANSISVIRFITVDGGVTWAGELVGGNYLK